MGRKADSQGTRGRDGKTSTTDPEFRTRREKIN